jgi:hypothetical protein
MFSGRFHKAAVVTDHARRRMAERNITDELLLDLIETGELRHKEPLGSASRNTMSNVTTTCYALWQY